MLSYVRAGIRCTVLNNVACITHDIALLFALGRSPRSLAKLVAPAHLTPKCRKSAMIEQQGI